MIGEVKNIARWIIPKTATMQCCLMKFFNLTESDLSKPRRASFILNVEMSELFIQAGLQDRVIQVYEGLVYMDFDKELFDKQGII